MQHIQESETRVGEIIRKNIFDESQRIYQPGVQDLNSNSKGNLSMIALKQDQTLDLLNCSMGSIDIIYKEPFQNDINNQTGFNINNKKIKTSQRKVDMQKELKNSDYNTASPINFRDSGTRGKPCSSNKNTYIKSQYKGKSERQCIEKSQEQIKKDQKKNHFRVLIYGYGDISPTTNKERILVIIFTLVSCAYYAYSINIIGTILADLNEDKQQFQKKLAQVQNYFKTHKVPLNLQNKALQDLQQLHKSRITKKKEFQTNLNNLSDYVKQEIVKSVYMDALNKITVFKNNFSKQFIEQLARYMQEDIYGKNEYILKQFSQDSNSYPKQNKIYPRLYFIAQGQVDLFYQSQFKNCGRYQKKIQILQENQVFGQVDFFSNNCQPNYSIRTNQITRIYSIGQQDFLECLKQFSDDKEIFQEIKDQIIYGNKHNRAYQICWSCNQGNHSLHKCPYLFYEPSTKSIGKKLQIKEQQFRKSYKRQILTNQEHALINLQNTNSHAQMIQEDMDFILNSKSNSDGCEDNRYSFSINQNNFPYFGSQQNLQHQESEDQYEAHTNMDDFQRFGTKRDSQQLEHQVNTLSSRQNIFENQQMTQENITDGYSPFPSPKKTQFLMADEIIQFHPTSFYFQEGDNKPFCQSQKTNEMVEEFNSASNNNNSSCCATSNNKTRLEIRKPQLSINTKMNKLSESADISKRSQLDYSNSFVEAKNSNIDKEYMKNKKLRLFVKNQSNTQDLVYNDTLKKIKTLTKIKQFSSKIMSKSPLKKQSTNSRDYQSIIDKQQLWLQQIYKQQDVYQKLHSEFLEIQLDRMFSFNYFFPEYNIENIIKQQDKHNQNYNQQESKESLKQKNHKYWNININKLTMGKILYNSDSYSNKIENYKKKYI